MKKTGLFKILLSLLFVVLILSFFVKGSYFSEELTMLPDEYQVPIGLFDIFELAFATLMYFAEKFIFILSVGAFYGVLAKTGKYRALVDKIAELLKGREKSFLISTVIVFAVLSSVFNYGLLLFMFIPFYIGVIIAMGYDKITALLTTIGAVIIGEFGSTFGYDISLTISQLLNIKLTSGIFYKVLLLAIGIAGLVIYILKSTHKRENANDLDLYVGEKQSNKFSVAPIITIFGILVVLLIIGCTNWSEVFNIKVFETFHNDLMATKIGNTEIFKKVIGSFYGLLYSQTGDTALGALGTWSYKEMSVVLLLSSLLTARFYKIKHKDVLNSMTDGAKRMLVPAMLVLFAHTLLLSSQYLLPTILNTILNITSKFNVVFSSLSMALSSLFNVGVPYAIYYGLPQLAAHGGNTTVIALMTQGIYGIVALVAPTSILLILGLSYLDIPYIEYLKRTWKYILILLAILMTLLLILNFVL